ncbi:MAG: hypothetical protein WKF84_24850 [Pyrinomonadaceae bacterium]
MDFRLEGFANGLTGGPVNLIHRKMGRLSGEGQEWLEGQSDYQNAATTGAVVGMVVLPGGPLMGLATGLRGASAGLSGLFAAGSVRSSSIIGIRQTLLSNGFTQGVSRNGQGYLL